jgi:hypothetical protein
MRVIVRKLRSGKYFKAPEEWTDNAQEAHDFKGTYQAIESKVWAKDEPVEIVFSFGEKKYDVSILVGAVESRLFPRLSAGKNVSRATKSRRENEAFHPDSGKGKSKPTNS